MTRPLLPLLRQSAEFLHRVACPGSTRLAIIVAIVVAVTSSAHAAAAPVPAAASGAGACIAGA